MNEEELKNPLVENSSDPKELLPAAQEKQNEILSELI